MSWFSSQWMTPFVVLIFVATCIVAEPVPGSSNPIDPEWCAAPDSPLTARRNALEGARKETAVRIELKLRLLDELIAGRLTLREVAGYFAELNAEYPLYAEMIHRTLRGHTDEERMARNVLDHLRGVPLPAQMKEAVFARVHQQFECQFGYSAE